MASTYFSLISIELDTLLSSDLEHDEDQARLQLNKSSELEYDEDQANLQLNKSSELDTVLSSELEHDEDQANLQLNNSSEIDTILSSELENDEDRANLQLNNSSEIDTVLSSELKYDENQANLLLNKLRLEIIEVKILEMFCSWLDVWDYIIADEQRNEISLKSMITHLKLIWVQQDNRLEDDDNFETWPKHLQDFHPLTFGLEGKIQQSKTLIGPWCQVLLRSYSMQMQCNKSSTDDHRMMNFRLSSIMGGLLIHKAAEIVPFKGQIYFLQNMINFMDSFSRIDECTESKELLEYRNFVYAFSYNATCLICLYWAKEANEETANEMNTALFDMLHKIKPCAAHVTACYFVVLNSNNLMKEEEGPTPASFVDFFFEHTILKDDFLILRERLVFLFTFLADASQENNEATAAEEEYCLIRSHIYALFCEHAYVHLPFSEMKEDFSNKMMLLSDFKNKIDTLTAKIIRLWCKPYDSWNTLEAEKMNNKYFAYLQRELSSYEQHTWPGPVRAQVNLYLTEIRFLRLFFRCFETWDDSDEKIRLQSRSLLTSLQRIWGQEYDMGLLWGRLYAIIKGYNDTEWGDGYLELKERFDIELKEKFQMSKQEISAWLVSLSHCSFHTRPSTGKKILKFLDSILYNMSDLVTFDACKDVAFQKKIEILEEKLLLLKNLLILATNCAHSNNLAEFNMFAVFFANNAACLVYLFWAKEANSEIPAETNLMISNMLQKIKPNTPHAARMYIGTLKAICLQPCDFFHLEQTVMSFVDYFFEDLVAPWKNDFQILRDELIFHLTFVHHHHHNGNAGEIICIQLDVLFSDGVYDLLPFDDLNGDFSKKKVGLSDFMMNIGTENAKITQLYCKFPDSFLYNFPRIIGQGFLDCLIHKLINLKERMIIDQKYAPFAKYKIMEIEEELVSLTPIFDQMLELNEQNDVWLEVVNVIYVADHVISLCYIFYQVIWHYIPYVSDVVKQIKVVMTKLEKIEECNMYNSRCISRSAGLMHTLSEQDQNSDIGVVVGFEADEKIIIDNITRGTESLDIVSIIGMGGLGKTTLAKKVYGSSLVKSNFNVSAFISVSQDYNKRRLLFDLLRDIVGVDAKAPHMTEDDLAHKLKKCLSRRKYFIVLDDIWNINAWYEVRSSFPNDHNGSRVMFTTRSLDVAKSGQIKCTPHCLSFLSEDESWNLLKTKLFHNEMPPPNIFSVAELVVKKCNGLPLAIVVIAGLLARTEKSLWIEISKRLSSYLFDEGCMDVLELSYKHLPEYLKPCLLYLGVFPEDSSYTVRQVTLLWIAEGFIKESKTKGLYDVAKEYLYELANRSLIIVDEMIIDEISTFHVHDLIHDLCQKKCQDDNFFQLGLGSATSSFSALPIYNHYRVSVRKLCDMSVDVEPSAANTRSLLYFPEDLDDSQRIFPLRKFRFGQMLYLKGLMLQESDFAQLTSVINLRHIEFRVSQVTTIPSSLSNLWNMQSLILRNMYYDELNLPDTLWRMKSLRYVKIKHCKLNFSDGYEELNNACPQLDKVVSFSRPTLFTGKDVEWLLQRLPAVRELDCILWFDYSERVETFDFHRKLESLKLHNPGRRPCLIKFPSTLIKLTLAGFELSWTAISTITELQCLRILKLRDVSFPEPAWEMQDVTFPYLKYFELHYSNLKLWNANTDSFPCLEQLFFDGTELEELPPCFGEISSLKKITVPDSTKLESSALLVQETQMDLGNKVVLVVLK